MWPCVDFVVHAKMSNLGSDVLMARRCFPNDFPYIGHIKI